MVSQLSFLVSLKNVCVSFSHQFPLLVLLSNPVHAPALFQKRNSIFLTHLTNIHSTKLLIRFFRQKKTRNENYAHQPSLQLFDYMSRKRRREQRTSFGSVFSNSFFQAKPCILNFHWQFQLLLLHISQNSKQICPVHFTSLICAFQLGSQFTNFLFLLILQKGH